MALELDFNGFLNDIKAYFVGLNRLEQIGFGLILLGVLLLVVGFVIGI